MWIFTVGMLDIQRKPKIKKPATNSLHLPLYDNDLKTESDINDLKKPKVTLFLYIIPPKARIRFNKEN